MSLVRVDVETIVVGGGPVASLVVLKPRNGAGKSQRPAIDDLSPHMEELHPAEPLEEGGEVEHFQPLPIRLGLTEAASIGMGVDNPVTNRPMTHDLFQNVLRELGVNLTNVIITGVEGTTFYSTLNLVLPDGRRVSVDARPSDAIALALRAKAPIFVESQVLETASCPDFEEVRRDENRKELAEFHEFLENLSPEDFSALN